VNFITDAIIQPVCTALIELALWLAIFSSTQATEIGGYAREYYLAYALWAAFVARISVSWMYEFKMIEEVESGSINGLLVKPMNFFEYYLSQLFGYKIITSLFSLMVPVAAVFILNLPTDFSKLPLAILLILYYLILVHCLSFIISTFAFHLNRVHSFTMAKNLALWLFSGELVPLDLLPEPWKSIVLNLPFCNAVYIPVGYINGRVSHELLMHGFYTNSIGILFFGFLSWFFWRWGISKYAGTGA
jgi:ABC-2 type transport system permease protein